MRGQYNKDNSLFVTAGGSGEAKIWSIPDCELKLKLQGHATKLHDCQFNPIY